MPSPPISWPRCAASWPGWVDASRAETKPFGAPTIDGRPRFDMGAEHTAERPALRRVNNPSDISPAYREVMENSAIVDMVSDLIGPNVKFHHCKINVKLPGSNTEVGYHQDFPYTPHTNDDIVTALLMLDDMTPENGCLTVVPGSHRGPLYSLFEKDVFVGSIDAQVTAKLKARETPGHRQGRQRLPDAYPAGAWLRRQPVERQNRGLYICVYSAADAFPAGGQSAAESERGQGRARPEIPAGAPDGCGDRTAGPGQGGILLRHPGAEICGRVKPSPIELLCFAPHRLSCRGLTRASVRMAKPTTSVGVDRRVKPGDDSFWKQG